MAETLLPDAWKEIVKNPYVSTNPYPSSSQAAWQKLYEVAPSLRRLYLDAWANLPAPKPTDRDTFIALAACFADPERREILRALLFELLADDFVELLTPAKEEGRG